MLLNIGQIPYLNSVLFYHALRDDAEVSLAPLVPRQLSGAAVEHAVDAGPVPLVTCWDIESHYEPLEDFCIATKTKAYSILFYSKRPVEELAGANVGITNETSTSVRLLKVLLQHRYQVSAGRFVQLDWPNNDAFLLIGDEALIHRKGVKDYPHLVDLGEVWNEWTGLPFVFARWMVRRDLETKSRDALVNKLTRALERGWNEFDAAVEPKAHELNMSVQEMRDYLEAFRFRMTDAEREAVERFRELDRKTRGSGPTGAASIDLEGVS